MYVFSDSVLCLGKQHGPEDAIRRSDQVSTSKMCLTFRELQGLDGDPIDFEWKIFPGAKAFDILHKFQADLQGKNIRPEKFSDRIIFMSMFNDIELSMTLNWKGKITKILVLLPQGRSNNMPQNSTMDTGHSWDPEKKASGIKDTQPNMVASGIFVRDRWWTIFENSGHPVFQGVSPLGRGILKNRNNRETNHFNGEYGNINLLYRTVHAANQLCITGQSQSSVDRILEKQAKSRPESARKMSPKNQIKQEDLKSLVDIPRLLHASGNRMLRNLKDFNSMPLMIKILTSPYNGEILPSDRKKKLRCHNYS